MPLQRGVVFLSVDVHHQTDPAMKALVARLAISDTPTFRFLKRGGQKVAPDVVGYQPSALSGTVATLVAAAGGIVDANSDHDW